MAPGTYQVEVNDNPNPYQQVTIPNLTLAGSAETLNVALQSTLTLPAPLISGIAPASGPSAGGTAVTISGSNFVAGATVTIGGAAATGVQMVNAATITATTPAGSLGVQPIVVTNPDRQSATLTPSSQCVTCGFDYK